MAKFVLSIFAIILLFELILFLLINFLRFKIPWVITNKDEYKLNKNFYPPKIQCPSNFKKCPCLN